MVGGAILGLLIGLGLVLPAAALLILGVTTLIGLQSWRLSVYLALAYLPVEGILWVAVYPHTAPAALAKDFLFVIPAYIGFLLVHQVKAERRLSGLPPPGGRAARRTGGRRDVQPTSPLTAGGTRRGQGLAHLHPHGVHRLPPDRGAVAIWTTCST